VVVVTHLLDTDHLSILQHPTSAAYPVVVGHVSSHPVGDVAASVVSVHEQTRGAHNAITQAKTPAAVVRGYRSLSAMLAVLSSFPVLPFDGPAAVVFDQLKAQKVRIGTMDLRIAAIALARGLTVVTRNARDFGQVPGLRLEDWTR
jgi:tRNA(fMet)-specific endonuclease VapC